MVEYKLQTQSTDSGTPTSARAYGINAFEDNRLIACIPEISTDKSAVIKLVENFNRYSLSVCHLEQALEDYLYDLRMD